MSELERRVEFYPAYDRSKETPNYGVHGVNLRFMLIGPERAVNLLIYTNWHLPHVTARQDATPSERFPHLSCHPLPAEIGCHTKTPQWDGQPLCKEECEYLKAPCYYGSSASDSQRFFDVLVAEGEEALWAKMKEYMDAS